MFQFQNAEVEIKVTFAVLPGPITGPNDHSLGLKAKRIYHLIYEEPHSISNLIIIW